jgi:hypothetical protein
MSRRSASSSISVVAVNGGRVDDAKYAPRSGGDILASSALPPAKPWSGTRMPFSGVKRSSWLDSSTSIASISSPRRMNSEQVSPVVRATSFSCARRRSAGEGVAPAASRENADPRA